MVFFHLCRGEERREKVRKTTEELAREAGAAGNIRALKSQPATPDPRDEALKMAREALLNCEGALDEIRGYPVTVDLVIEALAAIDKVLEG